MTTPSSPELETRDARLRLPPNKNGVSVNVERGVRLNYRRSATHGASGTWSVLVADGKRSFKMMRVATANDYKPANGADVMDFHQAAKAALEIAQGHRPASAARARFSAADLTRALLAAKAAGVAVRVEVATDGSMNVIMLGRVVRRKARQISAQNEG